MIDTIEIKATGSLHKIKDPAGVSYRFVTQDKECIPPVSMVLFRGDDECSEEVTRYKNAKITVTIETSKATKEFSIS